MNRPRFLCLLLLASACTGQIADRPGNLLSGSDGGGNGNGDGGTVAGDLPCDVATLLSSHCTSCHGSPPSGGAPMALDSLAAVRSNAQRSLTRMQDTASPMPPVPAARVPTPNIDAFAAWVDAGTPAGSCAPAGEPAFTGPPRCTSNSYWSNGNQGSALMHPGRACGDCHGAGEGPTFAIAGTVYPTGHEPDECNGTSAAGAVITVTDTNGTPQSFTANSAGNFFGQTSGTWPVFPITAQVSFNGNTRTMQGPVPSGDCNGCHTQSGSSAAPGRIALP